MKRLASLRTLSWVMAGMVALVGALAHANEVTGLLAAPPHATEAGALCPTEYADSFDRLSAQARDFERQQGAFTFCVRTAAVYECPVYASDGTLQHQRKKALAHGTGFAYRQQGGDTLLLTNDHVAEWPVVTDEAHPVEGVPSGCRRVSDTLSIVDNDEDDYERDDIPLSRVVTDPSLDMAVLKAHQLLPTMPWKVGKSAALRERNVVDVRGFPLGAFKANNVGKVISAFDRDEYKSWSHDDFVVDALLSPGNSGSPVFAISCKTGAFELVGVYHAGYIGGSALNLVVGIDQVRDLMTTLKRSPRRGDVVATLDAPAREQFLQWVRESPEAYFPLGTLPVAVKATAEGAVQYEVFPADFPLHAHPLLVLEDLPSANPQSYGQLGQVGFGSPRGLMLRPRAELDAESQGLLARALDALRRDGLGALMSQRAARASDGSREGFRAAARLERTMRKAAASREGLVADLVDLAEKLAPTDGDAPLSLAQLLQALRPTTAPPPAAPPPVSPRLSAELTRTSATP